MSDKSKPVHTGAGEAELRWFHEHKTELEAEHAGEWVAIGPEGIISIGRDLDAVMNEAAAKGFPNAIAKGIRAKEHQGTTFVGTWRRVS